MAGIRRLRRHDHPSLLLSFSSSSSTSTSTIHYGIDRETFPFLPFGLSHSYSHPTHLSFKRFHHRRLPLLRIRTDRNSPVSPTLPYTCTCTCMYTCLPHHLLTNRPAERPRLPIHSYQSLSPLSSLHCIASAFAVRCCAALLCFALLRCYCHWSIAVVALVRPYQRLAHLYRDCAHAHAHTHTTPLPSIRLPSTFQTL
ncbi:hypothetical protein BKA61DRAFT_298142 [Leptodontidium sp. MPI-SDFR-AT-0119]|nr:hypothetical protein BKA61DRAFT_298142 [Leptodontidium sp. MPI-SDFR-AT-0119]